MAIFAIEDDPQAGWDHVSGYRTIAFCVSPYAKRGAIVSTQYNTTSILRTIEQILGLPPMNQFDASATPMFDCFADTPDLTPYASVPSNIALDEMNPEPKAIDDPVLRQDAVVSATLNFREVDRAPEDVLNRILWRSRCAAARIPYPEWAISVVRRRRRLARVAWCWRWPLTDDFILPHQRRALPAAAHATSSRSYQVYLRIVDVTTMIASAIPAGLPVLDDDVDRQRDEGRLPDDAHEHVERVAEEVAVRLRSSGRGGPRRRGSVPTSPRAACGYRTPRAPTRVPAS